MIAVTSEVGGDLRNATLQVLQSTLGAFGFTDRTEIEHARVTGDLSGADDAC